MIRPLELASDVPHGSWSCRGTDIWDVLSAAARGDTAELGAILARDANLYRAEYWYTQPIHLAVQEGRLDAVRLLLEAGADPAQVTLDGEALVTIARDRGHEEIASLLEDASAARGSAAPAVDHEIHTAASAGDVQRVRALVEAEPLLVQRRDSQGGTPLHRAVAASATDVVRLLLDCGADIHAMHGHGGGNARGYASADFQPIDLALWTGPFWGVRGDLAMARLLIDRGAACDVTIAAALGDLHLVTRLLDEDPARIRDARPSGKRPLSSSVEQGHEAIARLLLSRGADPNWPEGATAARGVALHAAARTGHRALVDLLLAHGADPNGGVDSAGTATYAAKTPELRALLMSRGGALDAFDLVWMDEDDEVVRRVAADPRFAHTGCGGALAAACKRGNRDLLERLLAAGAEVPPVLTACRSYLLSDPELLRVLLASGMNPDLPNWRRATPLHDLASRDTRGRPHAHRLACASVLLDAGAAISARDETYRSTPLAWAARCDLPDMIELLLARGAPTNLPGDEPWATPLAWATRRGHTRAAELLRAAGATT